MFSTSNSTDAINPNIIQAETERSPIAGMRIFRQFGAMVGNSQSTSSNSASDGYVEFGISDTERSGRTLGTFAGVFSPVALSMFSALLFIRVGFLVGNAGLYEVLLQFIIAYAILLFTVSSVCAISTNGAVEGGGVYFMISRTLGPEFGGAIGTLFFFANIVGSALAISGCVEGIVENLGPGGYYGGESGFIQDSRWWRFLYCTLVNTLMLIVCLVGASLLAKTYVLILGIVIVCLISTFVSFLTQGEMEVSIPIENTIVQNKTHLVNYTYSGLSLDTFQHNLYEHYGKDYSSGNSQVTFAIVFGVLFSGVTGIMAGANMSGELKSPSRSIPVGTLSAVAFTFTCYVLLSVFIAATTTGELLRNNYLFLMPVNLWPFFVAIGILTATFSTALSNLIGSSRVLEAIARDRVYGRILDFVTRGTYRNNPILAVLISYLLVEAILLIGSLNLIAQINSVLFLLSYMATNLACLGIELTGAPNFRPTFKYFTWHTCLIGLLGTLIMMFIINFIYASISIILCLILIICLHIFSPISQKSDSGSISQALMFHQVRKYLLMLDSRKDHVKFWRPQMLLLVSSPRTSCPLIDFVNDMKKGGLYVLGHVKVGEFSDYDSNIDPTIEEYGKWLSLIDHMRVKAFAEVTMARTIREGIQHLIRISGMGAMKPNTIILGFYDEEKLTDFFANETSLYRTDKFDMNNDKIFPIRPDGSREHLTPEEYVAIICDVLRMKKNICLCRHFHRLDKHLIAKSNHILYIDVWPINVFDPTNNNPSMPYPFDVVSLFMLQLSCIINMLPKWKKLELRVFLCESNNSSRQSMNSSASSSFERPAEYKLRQLLKELRISASIHQIPEWSQNEEFAENGSILKLFTDNRETNEMDIFEEDINRSKLYMQGINKIIQERSNQSACTFLYLAPPPNIDSSNWQGASRQYLELLTELTVDLPPTILVHGVHTVTSTTL
ncbi:solute carrier family 12 member 9 isoform X2 [Sitodiplosis mosellana]|uniref:solute carrier family 12 member 9 isoform X2 n=2 Tax=Sitodiplosis mosellana TaxID=263140 RepID=UPI0024448C40|nr:solute carrier family 12 member 9 isoform X2 [Sitodiplosis mosellana]XP_055299606.1 solute carrier family 12 member 9 isoform X2 [Sitodiplosis mosellana]XP_055299608.1 solute carrier family 12 member 9 isoform X2 [Sitodiplosis mosellana]